ncbi:MULTISPECIES: hypothetical protein [Cyanophyceae]|uniref:hypothetical protein n=1 Tax=Cyanophyceae TaxID=3028117 RepID=UPI0016897999|nr:MULTISPECIES: hypothetical protein [Cyanophyceae]MBD1918297.1 hypothetical protein [Phormidium sp. FACHB-77]MBD2028813.1 hypothetical protein [Phormidium sp. FACHB-322]MBD2051234.1 hypothetical protein [Leptolyngbya sp. FACHB-60]
MKDVQPITPTTVRPLRVLGAIAAGAVLIMVGTVLLVEGIDRYQLWQADGIWCATLEPDGTITKSFGAKNCEF